MIIGWGFCDLSRLIKVDVGLISQSPRLRLITLTETFIIVHITKNESNNCLIAYLVLSLNETINWKSCFCFFTDGKHHKARKLDMITQTIMLRGHYNQPPWVSLTRLLYNLQLWCHRHWFRKFTVYFRPIRKEILSLISYVNFQIFHLPLFLFSWR